MIYKRKNWKLDFIKIYNYCNVKNLLRECKDKPQTERKNLQITYPTKDLYPELLKNSVKSTVKKARNPIRKWAKDRNRHFTKEQIQLTNKHMKECSTSLAIKEIQIKATVK